MSSQAGVERQSVRIFCGTLYTLKYVGGAVSPWLRINTIRTWYSSALTRMASPKARRCAQMVCRIVSTVPGNCRTNCMMCLLAEGHDVLVGCALAAARQMERH